MKFTVSKKFSTKVERTDRVIEVAESFGLGLDDREFVLFEDFELDIVPGDVVYITGQSGSGKTVLLNQCMAALIKDEQYVSNIDDVELLEVPLVDQVGDTTKEALEILSRVGLNDAYLFIRKPSELSDGQRYRLRLAHLINQPDVNVWVADEFGAVLDRVTAKIVAFSLQKHARKLGKTLIVATTHDDLLEELGPSLVIIKRFRDKVEISRNV